MKACLNCQKEYQDKRVHSKFCSVNCRVAFNRKNPKQGVSKFQMQVLYNNILAAVNQINERNGQPEAFAAILKSSIPETTVVPKFVPQVAKDAIMRKYVEDRRDCSCNEEYLNWLTRLEEDERLTKKDKELVKNTH